MMRQKEVVRRGLVDYRATQAAEQLLYYGHMTGKERLLAIVTMIRLMVEREPPENRFDFLAKISHIVQGMSEHDSLSTLHSYFKPHDLNQQESVE